MLAKLKVRLSINSAKPMMKPTTHVFTTLAAVTALTLVRPTALRASDVDLRLRRPAYVIPARPDAWQDPASQTAPGRTLNIPPGPLDEAMRAFAEATGVEVAFAVEGLGAIHSNGASGVLTAEQALVAILEGTGVTFRFDAASHLILDLEKHTEAVEVSGRLTTVASPKYTLPVRDIPQTIAVIPQPIIEEQGVRTLSEALANVPGITMQAGEGGGASNTSGDMFNMRGFSAANSIFVDGVRDDGLISRDVFNVEQVEVYMGPTGSDVGRGTAAGYVNMETKSPELRPLASALLSVGSADQKRLTFDLGTGLELGGPDSWLRHTAVRVNGLWQDGGVAGRDFVTAHSEAIAPSIALGLGTPTRVIVSGEALRESNVPDYGVPGAAWTDQALTPATVVAPAPVDQSNYYGSPAYDYDHATQHNYMARVEHDASPGLILRNQVRYNDTYREAVITSIPNVAAYNPANNLVTLSRQGNQRENQIFSEQASATGRFTALGFAHSANAGLEYTAEEQFAPTVGGVGTRAPVDIFNPNPYDPVLGYAVARTGAFSRGRTNTGALYAFDAVDLAPRWQLTGGLRWEYYETRYRAVDATGVATTDQSAADTIVSGKAGLLYRIGPSANIYLSYGTTATPPGSANFALSAQANNQNNPNVEPQRSTNYEVGSKWDVRGDRLSLAASVFHTINTNVIYTVDATAVPPIYNQDDGQQVNGVTIGATGHLTPRWQVLASFTYLDSRLVSQNAATNGNPLTLTPAHSGNAWTTYGPFRRITLGGGFRYTDSVFINPANTIQSPGYHLVDGLVQYQVNEHLTLRLNVYNLTDEVYIRNVNNNGGRYNPGSPRSTMLTSVIGF